MKRKLMYLAFLTALLSGCGMTPRQKFVTGCQSYRAVAEMFVQARRTGAIESDVLWARILAADAVVYQALSAYKLAIDASRPADAEWEAFNAALDKLLELYQRLPEPVDKAAPNNPSYMEVMAWQPTRSS